MVKFYLMIKFCDIVWCPEEDSLYSWALLMYLKIWCCFILVQVFSFMVCHHVSVLESCSACCTGSIDRMGSIMVQSNIVQALLTLQLCLWLWQNGSISLSEIFAFGAFHAQLMLLLLSSWWSISAMMIHL